MTEQRRRQEEEWASAIRATQTALSAAFDSDNQVVLCVIGIIIRRPVDGTPGSDAQLTIRCNSRMTPAMWADLCRSMAATHPVEDGVVDMPTG